MGASNYGAALALYKYTAAMILFRSTSPHLLVLYSSAGRVPVAAAMPYG